MRYSCTRMATVGVKGLQVPDHRTLKPLMQDNLKCDANKQN